MAAPELAKWEGKAEDFYFKFAGDPKRGGLVHIRETEELYDGNVTALDNQGRKEAILRCNGKYNGTISKWDEKETFGKRLKLRSRNTCCFHYKKR